jgi:lactoylglutathione lyase
MVSKEVSVAVMVSDSERSAKWFGEKLGFETSVEGHWVTVWPKGAGAKIHLCQGKPDPGNTGISFYVEDLESEVKRLKGNGVGFPVDYTVGEWGTFARFADPDGNEFWINQGSGP